MIIHSTKATFILCWLTSCTMPAVKSAQNSFSSSQSKEKLFFEAIRKNNVKEVLNLIENGADVNSKDEYGATLLHKVIENFSCNVPSCPPDKKINRAKINKEKISRFNRYFQVLKLLIGKGADVNMLNKDGNTPLHLAIEFKNFKVARFLIENGADVNFDIVKLLVKKGTFLDMLNEERDTTLHLAIKCGCSIKIIKPFLGNGTNLNTKNRDGDAPLHLVAKHNTSSDIGKLFIENGADVNMLNNYGNTPLHLALKHRCSIEIIKLLIEKGANLDILDNYGNTSVHLALKHGRDIEIIKLLIENGADVNILNKSGDAPLHLTAESNILAFKHDLCSIEIIKLLIENGADLNMLNKDGDTLLSLAIKFNDFHTAKVFIEKGANLDILDNYGDTPLHLAVKYGCSIGIIKLLIENGADVNILDNHGHTPLHLAVKSNNIVNLDLPLRHSCSIEIIKLLIENRADLNILNKDGHTPLHLAVKSHYPEMVKFFLENGANDDDKEFCLKEIIRYCFYGFSIPVRKSHGLMVDEFLKNGTNPNKVVDFDSLNIKLASLSGKGNYHCNIGNIKTILYQIKNTPQSHADKVQKIIDGYVRTQSEKQVLYVPKELYNIILKHTYVNPIKLDENNLKILEIILFSLGKIKT